VHLTEVLGGDEFLAPISMLLVEKVIGRVVWQSRPDGQASAMVVDQHERRVQNRILADVLGREGDERVLELVDVDIH